MAVALAIKAIDVSRRRKRITYNLTFSGNYSTGGDTLNLATASNPRFLDAGYPSRVPDQIDVMGNPGGTSAEAVLGTGMTDNKIKLFSAPNTELAAGAYNAAVTGDLNVQVEASWKIGV